MADVDTPFAGPMSFEEALTLNETRPEPDTSESDEEAPQEAQDAAEAAEAEAEDTAEAETDDAEESGADEGEESQLLTIDDYGEVRVQIGDEVITLAELAKGNLRQSDYTRKRQADAEEAKARAAELDAREARLAEKEQRIIAQLAQTEEQEPDWVQLAEDDPLGWPSKKAKWDAAQAKRAEALRAQQEQHQRAVEEFRMFTAHKAVEVFPEWKDPATFQSGADARKQIALAVGFTEQEFASASDFRLAALLELAVKGKASQTKTDAAQKRLAKAPKVLKPGAKVSKVDVQAAASVQRQKRLSQPMTFEEALKLGRE